MWLRLAAVCVMLAIAMPAVEGQGRKKGGKKKENEPLLIDAESLQPGVFRGRMVNPPGPEGDFLLAVDISFLKPKEGVKPPEKSGMNKVANLQRQLQRQVALAQRESNQGQVSAARLKQIQRLQARLRQQVAKAGNVGKYYELKTVSQKVQFRAMADVKVRLSEPAQPFTEKGEIKKFTAAELKQLKGKNPELVGFEGSLGDLRSNQIVQVLQIHAKASDLKNLNEKQSGGTGATAKKNVVSLIFILGEVEGPRDEVPRASKKRK